jgi:hypothetical protein
MFPLNITGSDRNKNCINIIDQHRHCLIDFQWGETFLKFCHKRTHCSSPRWYEFGEQQWNDIDRGKPKNTERTQAWLTVQSVQNGRYRDAEIYSAYKPEGRRAEAGLGKGGMSV